MSFHTLDYLLFLPLVILAYFLVPHRLRWILLLAASNVFYASWRVEFLVLIWFSILTDYAVTRAMTGASQRKRQMLLAVSLITNLGLLGLFKFAPTFSNSLFDQSGFSGGSAAYQFLLPLGISFYTFQTLGYVLDVYRGKREPEQHLGYFANFVMYFPQLIAGPVERAGKLLPQFQRDHNFNVARAAAGGALILVGYYKKLVIADGLSAAINPVMMADPATQTPLALIIGSLGTAYTYYADLSGYADIAVGSSLILGITLSQNFRRPFAAKSVTEFWQRWHITVSDWFRDQVYFPLVRLRSSSLPNRFGAIMLTMVIIGIWHGAQWSWLIVGVMSGLLISMGILARKWRARNGRPQTIQAWAAFILLAAPTERAILWVFLLTMGALVGSGSVSHAGQIGLEIMKLPEQLASFDLSSASAVPLYIIVAIAALEVFQWLDEKVSVFDRLRHAGRLWSWSFYLILIAVIIIFGSYNSPDFLYFQI